LAICATLQPIAAAASALVRVPAANSTMSVAMPAAASARATRAVDAAGSSVAGSTTRIT
jgi:hypothetical protein